MVTSISKSNIIIYTLLGSSYDRIEKNLHVLTYAHTYLSLETRTFCTRLCYQTNGSISPTTVSRSRVNDSYSPFVEARALGHHAQTTHTELTARVRSASCSRIGSSTKTFNPHHLPSKLLTHTPKQQTSAESDSYVAAVVEYHPTFVGATADEQLVHRVSEYVDYIGRAAAQSADIVVFPESTLTTIDQAQLVPDPADLLVPCDLDAYAGTALASVSCAARSGSLYVVINLTMRQRYDGKERLFNTNVVLDRKGTVISM